MKTILVPIDFNDNTTIATYTASHIAHASDAKIKLVHFIDFAWHEAFTNTSGVEYYDPINSLFLSDKIKNARLQIEALAEGTYFKNLSVETAVVTGVPSKRFSEIVKEPDIGMVLLTIDNSELSNLSAGNKHYISEATSTGTCPILMVHVPFQPAQVKHVLTVVHDEQDLELLMEDCAYIDSISHSVVHFVKFVLPEHGDLDYHVQQEINEAAENFGPTNYVCHQIRTDNVEESLMNLIAEYDIDLLALSAPPLDRNKQFRSSVLTRASLQNLSIPVWLFRATKKRKTSVFDSMIHLIF